MAWFKKITISFVSVLKDNNFVDASDPLRSKFNWSLENENV